MAFPARRLARLSFTMMVMITAWSSGAARVRAASAHTTIDQDYVAALAAANRFLQAWQNQDHETAILLLSDKVKQHTKEDRLEDFFTPAAHTQQAYEISSGKKLAPGRYIFAVTLFNSAAGKSPPHRPSHLIVTRTGKDDWAIDKLP